MTDLRLGLVGCGRLAETGYLPATKATGGVVVTAVADPDPARRDHVADLIRSSGGGDPTRHHDATELVAAGAVDAVVVASPVRAHTADAGVVAAAGLPALVEKPPAPDGPGAAALVALQPPPRVAFNRRFDPGVGAVRRAVPAREPVELHLEISYRRASWDAVEVADDALADLGPHLVDWARWLLGAEVVGVSDAHLSHEQATFALDLDRGRALVRAACDRPHREVVEVRSAGGAVLARHRRGGLVDGVRGRIRGGPHPLVASLAAQLAAFAAAVAGSPAPDLATAADGTACMAALDAARTSHAAGGMAVRLTARE